MKASVRADITREVTIALTDTGRAGLRDLVGHLASMAECLTGSPDLDLASAKLCEARQLIALLADGAGSGGEVVVVDGKRKSTPSPVRGPAGRPS